MTMRKILGKVFGPLSNKLRLYYLRGENVLCPICEGQFVTFLPFGVHLRPNAWCPNCGSLERQRLLWLYLNQAQLLSIDGLRIMHVAPELILFNKISPVKGIQYHPIDKFEPGYHYPSPTANMDLTDLAFEDAFFDLAICFHVLEHIPDDIQAMKEIRRVLKPGGTALLQVPVDYNRATTYEDFSITDPKEREKHFGQHDHVRVYGHDFEKRIVASGLAIKERWSAAQFNQDDQFKYGLKSDEIIYVCTR